MEVLFKNSWNLTLFLKRDPDLFNSSHLTTTMRYPFNSSLATTEANLPSKWPLPSIITNFSNISN